MHLRYFMVFFLTFACLIGKFSLYGKEKWAPDFIVVGAQKAGTGALRSYLRQHPLIVTSHEKEVHFFDFNFKKGAKWYEQQFPERPSSDHVMGEKTPSYIFDPRIPKRVFSLYPNVKIIMILRNPVSRAYSHYHFNLRRNKEHLSFEEALEAEPKRLVGERRKMKQDPSYRAIKYKRYSYLTRGMYADQIKRWLKYFPREQILIINCEDLSTNPLKPVNEVLAFLGLDPLGSLGKSEKKPSHYSPMNPETREKLIEFFRPYNQELEELTGIDFNWNK